MKADVIISIRPEWWHKITIGRKNVEARKSFPIKLLGLNHPSKSGFMAAVHVSGIPDISGFIHFYEITTDKNRMIAGSCLTKEEYEAYSNGQPVYGWCLDSAEKLKKQIPIEEFGISKPPQSWCYVKQRKEISVCQR